MAVEILERAQGSPSVNDTPMCIWNFLPSVSARHSPVHTSPFGPLRLIAFKELINRISVPASNNIPSEESKQSKIRADKVALGTQKRGNALQTEYDFLHANTESKGLSNTFQVGLKWTNLRNSEGFCLYLSLLFRGQQAMLQLSFLFLSLGGGCGLGGQAEFRGQHVLAERVAFTCSVIISSFDTQGLCARRWVIPLQVMVVLDDASGQ